MDESAIHIERLDFTYDKYPILHDIRLDIPSGKFSVVLGRNGCGKTTLLRLIAGLLPLQKGEIRVCGYELGKVSNFRRAEIVGYLPQMHSPIFPFTVEEVVMTGRAAYAFFSPKEEDRERAVRAMSQVGLMHLKKRPYTELSGGERQLVMVARLLAQAPRVILLDEPLTHLDPANQVRMLELIKELVRRQLTVLAVLHDPCTAFLYGERFIFLKNGSIYTPGTDIHPWDPDLLLEVYGTPFESVRHKDQVLVVPKQTR
jgi:iron complex transport system ATP-binding protein